MSELKYGNILCLCEVQCPGLVLDKPKLKKTLGRPRHKCEENIKM
jgi:hypothetical protein